ncbi:helix-turn-helix domain-containing protein [Saccharopolyspora sp. K220]|nr:helix-turn-helix domain-containing protein [Saccharopolyspora soli]
MRELHAQGKTRNDIAREIGRSPSTVSRLAHAAGLSFDRSKTAAATQAKQRDNAARRADLVRRLYGRGEANLGRLEAPRYKFTTATVNGIETKVLDHVPAQWAHTGRLAKRAPDAQGRPRYRVGEVIDLPCRRRREPQLPESARSVAAACEHEPMGGLRTIGEYWKKQPPSKRWQLTMSVGVLACALLDMVLLAIDASKPAHWTLATVWVLWIVTTAAVSIRAKRREGQQ